MKKTFLIFSIAFILYACDNSSTDSVEKADSANKAIQDSALNNNKMVVDEAASSFLVRVADAGMTEVRITSITMKKAAHQPVKDFATMLNKEHSDLNDQVKDLADQKNVVLPQNISEEKQKEIDMLDNSEGKEHDKTFINMMISKHQSSIEMFEKAVQEVADYDIKTFAEKTLPTLKSHLEAAKSLQKKYQ
jgi:putative membrane protein